MICHTKITIPIENLDAVRAELARRKAPIVGTSVVLSVLLEYDQAFGPLLRDLTEGLGYAEARVDYPKSTRQGRVPDASS
jgi:hypothetical protein